MLPNRLCAVWRVEMTFKRDIRKVERIVFWFASILFSVSIAMLGYACTIAPLKYNYASSDARIHCSRDCPGPDCLCIMGSKNTWYLSPEIGDEK